MPPPNAPVTVIFPPSIALPGPVARELAQVADDLPEVEDSACRDDRAVDLGGRRLDVPAPVVVDDDEVVDAERADDPHLRRRTALASAVVSFGSTALTTAATGVAGAPAWRAAIRADDRGLHAGGVERSALAAGAGGDHVSADPLEARVLRGLVDLLGQRLEDRVEARLVQGRGDGPVGCGRERDQRRKARAGDLPALLAPGDDHVGGHSIRGRRRRLGRGSATAGATGATGTSTRSTPACRALRAAGRGRSAWPPGPRRDRPSPGETLNVPPWPGRHGCVHRGLVDRRGERLDGGRQLVAVEGNGGVEGDAVDRGPGCADEVREGLALAARRECRVSQDRGVWAAADVGVADGRRLAVRAGERDLPGAERS